MRFYSTIALLLATARISFTLDPNSVPIATRKRWCEMQKTSCPLLCLQLPDGSAETEHNDCDPVTLVYQCVCSNGKSPNSTEYSQTIPYFICTEENNQCVSNCGQNNICQNNCRVDHPCGASDPTRYNTTSSSSVSGTASKTASGTADSTNTGDYAGFGTGAASTTGAKGGSGAGVPTMNLGQVYGIVIVIAGFFGGFALVL